MIEPDIDIIYGSYHPNKGRFHFDKEELDYGGDWVYFEIESHPSMIHAFKLYADAEDYYVEPDYSNAVPDDDPMKLILKESENLDMARIENDVPILLICVTSQGIDGKCFG